MNIKQKKSTIEEGILKDHLAIYKANPIPENEILSNLHLFTKPQDLKRTLFIHELYKMIINVPGDILEFGVRWGGDLVLFQNLRDIYEPYNHLRKIVGFDTFQGFPSVSEIDKAKVGDYSVTEEYEQYLQNLLEVNESFSALPHINKFELQIGDVKDTLPKYLESNSNQCFSLIYFDLDLYEPTKYCLSKIITHVTKGSIIVFDDFNGKSFRGESLAVKEIFKDFREINLKAHPLFQRAAYMII